MPRILTALVLASTLRLAQLRFYECPSTVPDPTDPGGPTSDLCGRTGND